jgi:hypothetical protein
MSNKSPRTGSLAIGRNASGITLSYTVSSAVLVLFFFGLVGGVLGGVVIEDSW